MQLLDPFFSWRWTVNLLEEMTPPRSPSAWFIQVHIITFTLKNLALQVTCTILEQFNSAAMHNSCNMVKDLPWFLNCIPISPDQTFSTLGIGPVVVDAFVLCFSLLPEYPVFICTEICISHYANAAGVQIDGEGPVWAHGNMESTSATWKARTTQVCPQNGDQQPPYLLCPRVSPL